MSDTTVTTFGPAAALVSSAIWAFASTQYTRVSRNIGSARVNLLRTLIVLPCFIACTFIFDPAPLAQLSWNRSFWLLGSVLCSYGGADLLFFASARRLGISTALAIASTYPLWAAVWGTAVNHEALTGARVVGTLLCIGGVAALVLHGRSAALEQRRVVIGGALLGLAVSVLWAGNSICTKAGTTGIAPFTANCIRYSWSLPILLGFVAVSPRPSAPIAAGFRPLFFVALLEAFAGSTLFVYALAHTDLSVGATLTSLAPLFSVPIAILLKQERYSHVRALGILATVAGATVLLARPGQ